MNCQIKWIDKNGKSTADENQAVAMAHFHKPLWLHPHGGIDNRVVGYSPEIQDSFPICQEHLATVTPHFQGWSFTPLEDLRYDYENQAWIRDGRYQRCAHPESMDCQCYGKIHAGEESAQ